MTGVNGRAGGTVEDLAAMERARREGRVKVLRLNPRHVLALFQAHDRDWLAVPRLSGVPEGTEVLSVNVEWPPGCFTLLVCHPTFEPVPECEVPPDAGGGTGLTWEMVRLEHGAAAPDEPVYRVAKL
jgi:hypothetical protein